MFGLGDFCQEIGVIAKLIQKKLWLIFKGTKQKKIFFENGWLKKTEFFKIANSEIFCQNAT